MVTGQCEAQVIREIMGSVVRRIQAADGMITDSLPSQSLLSELPHLTQGGVGDTLQLVLRVPGDLGV